MQSSAAETMRQNSTGIRIRFRPRSPAPHLALANLGAGTRAAPRKSRLRSLRLPVIALTCSEDAPVAFNASSSCVRLLISRSSCSCTRFLALRSFFSRFWYITANTDKNQPSACSSSRSAVECRAFFRDGASTNTCHNDLAGRPGVPGSPGGGTPARSKSNEIILAYHCTAGGFTASTGGPGPRARV